MTFRIALVPLVVYLACVFKSRLRTWARINNFRAEDESLIRIDDVFMEVYNEPTSTCGVWTREVFIEDAQRRAIEFELNNGVNAAIGSNSLDQHVSKSDFEERD